MTATQPITKIRACNLRRGNKFIKQNVQYRVVRNRDGKIEYVSGRNTGYHLQFIGSNSQEWVELVTGRAKG